VAMDGTKAFQVIGVRDSREERQGLRRPVRVERRPARLPGGVLARRIHPSTVPMLRGPVAPAPLRSHTALRGSIAGTSDSLVAMWAARQCPEGGCRG
jgi:hypothetical protein